MIGWSITTITDLIKACETYLQWSICWKRKTRQTLIPTPSFLLFNKFCQHQQQNEIFYSFTKQNEIIILSNVRGDLQSGRWKIIHKSGCGCIIMSGHIVLCNTSLPEIFYWNMEKSKTTIQRIFPHSNKILTTTTINY